MNKYDEFIDEPVHVVTYNPKWVEYFQVEKKILMLALNKEIVAIEHIGSTAIPGLASKSIIDIMIGIDLFPPTTLWITQVRSLGYAFHGEAGVPERLYFTKRGIINFNLAVVLYKGDHWKNNLKIKNFLIKHPEFRIEYEKN